MNKLLAIFSAFLFFFFRWFCAMFFRVIIIFLFTFSVLFIEAQETFSIVAIDSATGEIGSAGASCVEGSIIISDIVPGKGAMNAQARVCRPNSNLENGIGFIEARQSAEEVLIKTLENDNCIAGDTTERQYGVVVLSPASIISVASYTGSNCLDYKSHNTGPRYSIQGNILAGHHVLDSMEARFLRTEGDFACKLMAALQGANIPGADTRCLVEGTSSKSAFIRVAKYLDPVDSLWIDINVNSVPTGVEPIDSLQKLFDLVYSCGLEDTSASGTRLLRDDRDIKVYPVPSSNSLIFEVSGNGNKNLLPYTVKIHSSTGGVSVSKEVGAKLFSFDIQDWPAGVYFYSLTRQNNIIKQGKIVVQ